MLVDLGEHSLASLEPAVDARVVRTKVTGPSALLLAKVFDVDAERCPDCGGRLRPVGAVTRREEARAALAAGLSVLGARGPPAAA